MNTNEHECYLRKSSAIASRKLGDELIVMATDTSSVFTLNEVAAVIWEAADGVTSLRTIVMERIVPIYDVGFEKAYSDAEKVVSGLASHGVIEVGSEPFAG
jgi:hypothetical protein